VAIVASAPDVLKVWTVLDGASKMRANRRERAQIPLWCAKDNPRFLPEPKNLPSVRRKVATPTYHNACHPGFGLLRRQNVPGHRVENPCQESCQSPAKDPTEDTASGDSGSSLPWLGHYLLRHLSGPLSEQSAPRPPPCAPLVQISANFRTMSSKSLFSASPNFNSPTTCPLNRDASRNSPATDSPASAVPAVFSRRPCRREKELHPSREKPVGVSCFSPRNSPTKPSFLFCLPTLGHVKASFCIRALVKTSSGCFPRFSPNKVSRCAPR